MSLHITCTVSSFFFLENHQWLNCWGINETKEASDWTRIYWCERQRLAQIAGSIYCSRLILLAIEPRVRLWMPCSVRRRPTVWLSRFPPSAASTNCLGIIPARIPPASLRKSRGKRSRLPRMTGGRVARPVRAAWTTLRSAIQAAWDSLFTAERCSNGIFSIFTR